jgi:hypothetical protein
MEKVNRKMDSSGKSHKNKKSLEKEVKDQVM